MNNYDYPIGADTDYAPWNAIDQHDIAFDVLVTQTLSKSDVVSTNQYDAYYIGRDRDGDAVIDYDTSNVDWENEWTQKSIGINDLLDILKKYVIDDMERTPNTDKKRIDYLERVMDACSGWVVDETMVENER